jgi:type II restriction enzyme
MLHNCTAGAIFVTAFQSFDEFRKQMRNIAWETEVWVAEEPEHLIHFNGDRFLGPRT